MPEKNIGNRSQSDLNLIMIIRQLLIDNGLENNVLSYYDTNPIIIDNINKSSIIQIDALNNYWNLQILFIEQNNNVSTQGIRQYGLLRDVNDKLWLKSFKHELLNFIVRYDLPTNINKSIY